jgi:hypothetical protein
MGSISAGVFHAKAIIFVCIHDTPGGGGLHSIRAN